MKKILVSMFLLVFGLCLVGCENNKNIKYEGSYKGTLICQHVAVSSWVSDLNINIIDNTLFINDNESGMFKEVDLSSSTLKFDSLSYYHNYENVENEFENVNIGYFVNIKNNDFSTGYLLVESNNKLYLFFIDKVDKSSYQIFKGYYLNNEVELKFTNYSGGCIFMQYSERVKIGSTYNLSEAKSNLFVDAFIDLKTLTVYDDEIVVKENLDLIAYNNGVYSDYIIEYILSNENLAFNNSFYTFEELEGYEYELIDDEIIIIDKNITYTFTKSYQLSQCYYLKEIKSNKVLFDNLEKATNALKILYGNDNYESYNITVELKDNGYIIKLAEHFLAG